MKYKYLKNRLSEPGILIFIEKHHTRYFVCSTTQDYLDVAMLVLKQRLKDGYWYYDDELTEEELAAKKGYEYARAYYQPRELSRDETIARRIVKGKDKEEAFVFLDFRNRYEYERMKIERPEKYKRNKFAV